MVSSLPTGWVYARLRELGDVQLGKMLDKNRTRGIACAYLRNANVQWDRIDTSDLLEMPFEPHEAEKFALRSGDVLVCEGGEPGRAAVWRAEDTNVKFQKALHRVRLRAGIEPDWLVHLLFLDAHAGALAKHFTGTTIGHLPREVFVEYEVPVAPAAEQHRIVEALESYLSRLDEAEAVLERAERNLKRYRAAVLQAAVEGRLVPTEAELARAEGRNYEPASELLKRILAERRRRWEEAELARLKGAGKAPKDDKWKAKYEQPVSPAATGLPSLPEGWCWATLPQLGELNRGKSKHRPRNDPRLLGGPYPFIQTGDVKKADGVIKTYEATYSEIGLAQSRLWPSGTLCITIAANIAETGILGLDACFPDSVVGFLNSSQPLLTRFIEFFLRTARARLEQFAPATAQKNINLETLSEVAIPLPPSSEQERIVAELDDILSVTARTDQAIEENTRRTGRLRQSILKWAFEGKLVDQDPNDEPASVLLERIRGERDAQGQPRARRVRGRTPTA